MSSHSHLCPHCRCPSPTLSISTSSDFSAPSVFSSTSSASSATTHNPFDLARVLLAHRIHLAHHLLNSASDSEDLGDDEALSADTVPDWDGFTLGDTSDGSRASDESGVFEGYPFVGNAPGYGGLAHVGNAHEYVGPGYGDPLVPVGVGELNAGNAAAHDGHGHGHPHAHPAPQVLGSGSDDSKEEEQGNDEEKEKGYDGGDEYSTDDEVYRTYLAASNALGLWNRDSDSTALNHTNSHQEHETHFSGHRTSIPSTTPYSAGADRRAKELPPQLPPLNLPGPELVPKGVDVLDYLLGEHGR